MAGRRREDRPAAPLAPWPREEEEEAYKPFDATRYARFFEHPWLSDPARQFLFQERRLDPRVVAWCRLTSWTDRHGTHWLQTPYYDTHMRLVGLQNRNLDYKKSAPAEAQTTARATSSEPMAQPRFRFPQGSRCGLYNQPVLLRLRPGEPLWITEGCSDCWAMLSSGHKAVAIPSATTLHDAEVRLLLDLHDRLGTPFHMYPDADVPGERLFLQLRDLLPGLVHHHLPPGCKDFSDYYLSITKIEKSS